MDVFDVQKVAETNRAVDPKQVTDAIEVRRKLEAVGAFRPAEYRIAPALGAVAQPSTISRRMSPVV
jgi:hypothetical protein